MASPPLFSLILISALWVWSRGCHSSRHGTIDDVDSRHTVAVQSLIARDVFPSEDGDRKSLKVVHRRTKLTPEESLILDESRAEWLRQLRRATVIETQRAARRRSRGPTTTIIPARSGRALGTGNYAVTVGFGTPKKDLSLVLDTGSDLTWIQCAPCSRSCYQQDEPLFDPGLSSSYKNISCRSPECSDLQSATGKKPGCAAASCVYGVRYGDGSYSIGFYAHETITLKNTDVLPGVRIGCGENNKGLFGQAGGLLGLGRGDVSLVSQTAGKYRRVFSYCLPSSPSSDGYLALGRTAPKSGTAVKYTPMLTDASLKSFYFLEVVGISVGGKELSIPSSVFTTAGTLIDSGTVISRFPPAAYVALRSAFREQMLSYPTAPALSILDTCYDFTGYDTVSIPKVTLLFRGKVSLDVHVSGILYAAKISQACLAFAGNNDPTDLAILGNAQQKTYQIVYDAAKRAIGFGRGGCS